MDAGDRYEIREFLGAGGMAQVYRAHDRLLDREVALKVLRTDTDKQLQRARREARTLARLNHPAICQVFDTGDFRGKPFVAMELVEGSTLHAEFERLPLRQRILLLATVARGVHAAHLAGLVHGDLKPANVLLRRIASSSNPNGIRRASDWQPLVADFGIAREIAQEVAPSDGAPRPGASQAETSGIYGTAHYMAPEQVRGSRQGDEPAADVWALGVILFRSLADELPFAGEDPTDVLVQVTSGSAPDLRQSRPDVPGELAAITAKCLQNRPADRYASALALAEDLERWLGHRPVTAMSTPPAQHLRLWARRHPFAAAAAAVLTVVGCIAGVLWQRERNWNERQQRWALVFGNEAAQIASRMRIARLAPAHDLGRDRNRARREILELQEEIAAAPPEAAAAGAYAVGLAEAGLRNYVASQKALEQAQQLGLRNPEVSAALARVLVFRYGQEITDLVHLRRSLRQVRLAELNRQLLEPARALLAEAPRQGQADFLREALSEFSRNTTEPDTATTGLGGRLAEALDDDPTRFELVELRGHWLLRRSLAAEARGEDAQALQTLHAARDAFLEVTEIARSHAEAHLLACQVEEAIFDLQLRSGLSPDLSTPASCTRAQELDPEGADPLIARAFYEQRAALSAYRRSDPHEALLQQARDSWQLAETTVESDAQQRRIDRGMATQLLLESDLTSWHAAASQSPLEGAVERARRAAEGVDSIEPAVVLGQTLMSLAMSRAAGGEELTSVRSAVQEGRDVLSDVVDRAPDLSLARMVRATLLDWFAQHLMEIGDPGSEEYWSAARNDFEIAARLDPGNATILSNHAISWLVEADARWYLGEDPTLAVREGDVLFRKALELSPNRAILHFNRSLLWQYATRHALQTGVPADQAAAEMSASHQRAFERDPLEYGCSAGTAAWLEARAADRGAQVADRIGAGLRPIDQVLSQYPNSWRCLRDRARLLLTAARRARSSPIERVALSAELSSAPGAFGSTPSQWLAAALATVEDALRDRGENEELLWILAEVQRERALGGGPREVTFAASRAALEAYERQARARPGRWNSEERRAELEELLRLAPPEGVESPVR